VHIRRCYDGTFLPIVRSTLGGRLESSYLELPRDRSSNTLVTSLLPCCQPIHGADSNLGTASVHRMRGWCWRCRTARTLGARRGGSFVCEGEDRRGRRRKVNGTAMWSCVQTECFVTFVQRYTW
jgi:hypothetical protein